MASALLHLPVLLFGMAAWLSINTIYVELPILSAIVPESWNFTSFIVVIIQISCIFPLGYSLLRVRFPSGMALAEAPLVVFLLLIDIVGLLLTTLTYTLRVEIAGGLHSLWLLLSLLVLCIPCTMADVLFLPLIGRLGSSSSVVTTFYIGMGLGAFVPSALSFAQGTPKVTSNTTDPLDPSFTVDASFSFPVFVYIICVFVLVSLLAYLYLFFYSRRHSTVVEVVDVPEKSLEESPMLLPLLISLVAGAFQNAVLPSLISYAAAPYSSDTYHLATTLFVVTNPLFCLLQHFYSFSSSRLLWLLCVLSSVPSLFIVVLSCLRSALTGGSVLFLMASASSAGLLSLLRTAAASRLASHSNGRALFLCGAATQGGSFVGAITVFILANVFHIFPAS